MNSIYKKNIAGTLVTQYGNVAIGFISSVFLTRMLSDFGRGELALYTNFTSLAILFFSFSLPVGVIYYVSSGTITTSRIFIICIAFFSACTAILLALLLGMEQMDYIRLVFSPDNQQMPSYLVLALYFFSMSLNAVIAGIFNGLKKINIINRISLSFVVINLCLLLAIYFTGFYKGKNIFFIAITLQCIIQFVQLLINCIILYRHKQDPLPAGGSTRIRQDLKKLFRFSRLIYFTNILAFFAYKLDVWIVDYYRGTAELGIYALAVTLAQLLWLMPNAVALINISEVAGEKDADKSSSLTVQTYKLALYFTIISSVAFLVLCYLFVPALYGEKFDRVPYYILLLLAGVVPFAPATIISAYLTGRDKYKQNLYAVTVGLAICIILDFILIPRWGVTGACIASSISYLIICIYLTRYFVLLTGCTYSELLLVKKQDFINFRKFLRAKVSK